ncbi:MAG: hypothetical protein ABH950_01545 [Candidatus Altiarchaeota archaeon]
MMKIVFDSDALIKLGKTKRFPKILEKMDACISEEVFKECVTEGKTRLYEDAFRLEEMIQKGRLRVERTNERMEAKGILKEVFNLGRGEKSTLHLYFKNKPQAIVSDDQAFLDVLYVNNIPFLTTTDLLVRLVELKKIKRDECRETLEEIKPYIPHKRYLESLEIINGGKK